MSLPDDTCLELSIDLSAFLDLSVDLPGGLSLQAKFEPGELPNLAGIVQSVLEPLNAALTPLMPFFRLLDVVIAIIEVIKAIPDSFGPPPDPTLLIKRIKKLLKAFAKLANLIPPLSIPIMIVGICKLIVAALLALIDQLEHSITVQASLDLSRSKADAFSLDPELAGVAAGLSASIDCAQADLDLMLSVSGAGLGPLNKFIDLLNAFAGLIGLPEFGKIGGSANPLAALDGLKSVVEALGAVCTAIPV